MTPYSLSSSPSDFLRTYLFTAVLSSLVLLGVSSYGVYQLFERYVVNMAESNALSLAVSIVAAQEKVLEQALDNTDFDQGRLSEVDTALRAFLKPYGILKIKLFSPQGVIVYSTDARVIGSPSLTNLDLDKALAGGSSSSIQTKDQIHDLTNEERFNVDVVESYVAMHSSKGEVIGAFEIYQDMTRFRDELESGVVTFFLGLSVILFFVVCASYSFMRTASHKLRAQQKMLQHLATIDPVTGLDNRAEITRKVDAEWERVKRGDPAAKGFGIMMLDLDHFKAINDTYGHQVGDQLLMHIAHRLQGELRQYSDVGRYGGEEFMILLPDIALAQLKNTAERIIRMLAAEPYKIAGHSIKMTASAGVAVSEYNDLNIDVIIKRADDNLYKAKDQGRNRVCAEPSEIEN